MSIESAKDYITRMREDAAFRRMINDCEDEAKNWEVVKEHGYDFTMDEFRQACDLTSKEHGIDPMK